MDCVGKCYVALESNAGFPSRKVGAAPVRVDILLFQPVIIMQTFQIKQPKHKPINNSSIYSIFDVSGIPALAGSIVHKRETLLYAVVEPIFLVKALAEIVCCL